MPAARWRSGGRPSHDGVPWVDFHGLPDAMKDHGVSLSAFAIENAAATLRIELNPAVVAAGCRSYLRPQAAQLPLRVTNWGHVEGASLEAEVARHTPECFLIGVKLVLAAAPLQSSTVQPSRFERATTNAGGVVDRARKACETATALGPGGEANVLVPTAGDFRNTSQAADLTDAEAAGKIHAIRAAATVAAVAAPEGICQDPLLQGVPRALQHLAFGALAGAAGKSCAMSSSLTMHVGCPKGVGRGRAPALRPSPEAPGSPTSARRTTTSSSHSSTTKATARQARTLLRPLTAP